MGNPILDPGTWVHDYCMAHVKYLNTEQMKFITETERCHMFEKSV